MIRLFIQSLHLRKGLYFFHSKKETVHWYEYLSLVFGGLNDSLCISEEGIFIGNPTNCQRTKEILVDNIWRSGVKVGLLSIAKCHVPSQVTRADYLSGRTALHFAAVNGHVRCIRLLVADFVPSAPYETITSVNDGDRSNRSLRYVHERHRIWILQV